MFTTLPEAFKKFDLAVDVRALLLLQRAMDKGLVRTIGDLFNVLRTFIIKDPEHVGPYTKAFYAYFLDINIRPNDRLNDAILRSQTFEQWKETNFGRIEDNITPDEWVNRFLDQVHLTHYDIKEVLDGRELWDKDKGDLEDNPEGNKDEALNRPLDRMADYSDLTLEELMQRMGEVKEQQQSEHSGGSHWIGTGGISPYGYGGAAKDGIRVGGSGGGKMARKVLGDSNFFPVDLEAILNDNNIDAALASLKGIVEETAHEILDVKETIEKGLERGGLFIPEIKNETFDKLQVLLIIDNGGYSMHPYIKSVQTLFRKMKTRFAHDLETYYFHNTVYRQVFTDSQRRKSLPIERLLSKDPNYHVFFIGDAAMAPYELDRASLNTYSEIKEHFKKVAWLNPEPVRYWNGTLSTQIIKELLPMYPLTPKGIEQAVLEMNRKK
ncbi:MAG: hypothetical protein ACKVHT_09205 [Flavobacteriales bacterium]|jgi:uncharacterized protein with von Willebrand factor type A (vWA) domain|tara:strand:- start:99 stop:1412 length:1314 start_codon:yes stop_codon:yes gene_type:complete